MSCRHINKITVKKNVIVIVVGPFLGSLTDKEIQDIFIFFYSYHFGHTGSYSRGATKPTLTTAIKIDIHSMGLPQILNLSGWVQTQKSFSSQRFNTHGALIR